MTAEQALDELAGAYANLERTATTVLSVSSPRYAISSDDFAIVGPVTEEPEPRERRGESKPEEYITVGLDLVRRTQVKP